MPHIDKPPRIKRVHKPDVFGHIPDIPVGTTFASRQECSDYAVHPGILAGIYGRKNEGAFSVVMSGGYEDDEDKGYTFTYTGCGGRDLGSENKARMGPQAYDQSFERNDKNMALKVSSMTRKPVRVVRGHKLRSDFAPAEGYRYDGLYTVEHAWVETGKSGYGVCKFFFRRIEGQPPIPRREGTLNLKLPKKYRRPSVSERKSDSASRELPHEQRQPIQRVPPLEQRRPVQREYPLEQRRPVQREPLLEQKRPVQREPPLEQKRPVQREFPLEQRRTVQRAPPLEQKRPVQRARSPSERKPLIFKDTFKGNAGSSNDAQKKLSVPIPRTSTSTAAVTLSPSVRNPLPFTVTPINAPPPWTKLKFKKKRPRSEDDGDLAQDRASAVRHCPDAWAGDVKPLASAHMGTSRKPARVAPGVIPQFGDSQRQAPLPRRIQPHFGSSLARALPQELVPAGGQRFVGLPARDTRSGAFDAPRADDAMDVDDPAEFDAPNLDLMNLMWPESA